jgi:IPT/TIG domain
MVIWRTCAPSFGFFSYGPDAVAGFDVRFDNIRIRNYTFPEPMVALGAETASGARVSIDGQLCANVIVRNGGTLTCNTPAHPVGTADVTITNPDGQTYALVGGFTYFKAYPIYLPLVQR